MSVLQARSRTLGDSSPVMRAALAVLRVAGAGLLVTNAAIHAHLWNVGYRTIPTIGTLFLLDAIAAAALALVTLVVPLRWLAAAAVLGALLEAGTVGGLVLSTERGLFGFIESSRATLYWQSAITEIVGAVILAALAGLAYRYARGGATNAWW